jgi:hypothetical protein
MSKSEKINLKDALHELTEVNPGDRPLYLRWMRMNGWIGAAASLDRWWNGEPKRHQRGADALETQAAARDGRAFNRDIRCDCEHCRRYWAKVENLNSTEDQRGT